MLRVSRFIIPSFICNVSNRFPMKMLFSNSRQIKDPTKESDAARKARLVYQSRKRGNLENGILLSSFFDEWMDKLSSDQLQAYDKLINVPDNEWDLYYWIVGSRKAPEEFQTSVLQLLQEYAVNRKSELRNQQPPLKQTCKQ